MNVFNETTIFGNNIKSICQDDYGDIWVGTELGLSKLDTRTRKFKRIVNTKYNLKDIEKIFNDKDKCDYVALNYDEITKGFTPSFIHQLECSIHPDHVWWKREKDTDSSKYDARCSAYLKMGGGKPDQFCLSFYSDILPPVVCNKYGALGWVPTITLTTHIRQLPTTEDIYADFKATDINKGYFEQNLSMWDLNENLVATSKQIAKVLKSNERLGKN